MRHATMAVLLFTGCTSAPSSKDAGIDASNACTADGGTDAGVTAGA